VRSARFLVLPPDVLSNVRHHTTHGPFHSFSSTCRLTCQPGIMTRRRLPRREESLVGCLTPGVCRVPQRNRGRVVRAVHGSWSSGSSSTVARPTAWPEHSTNRASGRRSAVQASRHGASPTWVVQLRSVPMTSPYDPLAKNQLTESVKRALTGQACAVLPPSAPFKGAGVYALYYSGAFNPYTPIARANADTPCSFPIYVGRAKVSGSRKGRKSPRDDRPLYRRLREHARSIAASPSLLSADFTCRYLVVEEPWIALLAEDAMIRDFRPLWNVVIDGFGNHAPGRGRYDQARSPWDVLHPGRKWAERLPDPRLTREDLLRRIAEHLG